MAAFYSFILCIEKKVKNEESNLARKTVRCIHLKLLESGAVGHLRYHEDTDMDDSSDEEDE